jgi:hypothetical protein
MAHATLCHSVHEQKPIEEWLYEKYALGGCQRLLLAMRFLTQLNPIAMHIGAQACFPDHSGEATAQTILVLSPQGTPRAGETRKLIRPCCEDLTQ